MPATSVFSLMFWLPICVLVLIAVSPPESDTVAELVTEWTAAVLLLSMAVGATGWLVAA